MLERMISLRQEGYTWNQVEKILFGTDVPPGKAAPGCSKLLRKNKDRCAAAFEKRVYGAFTPTQVVVPIRTFEPSETAKALTELLRVA